jgi:hypothetical protein
MFTARAAIGASRSRLILQKSSRGLPDDLVSQWRTKGFRAECA